MTSPANVLIVGASASVGGKVVRAFAAQAQRVLATFHATPLADLPANAEGVSLDLSDPASRRRLRDHLAAAVPRLDAIVLLPGVIVGRDLSEYDPAEAARVMALNFTCQALLIKDIEPLFSPAARLLIVSSISAERGSFDPFYAASKGALLPFAKSLASARKTKWTTTVVLPGAIEDSRMFEEMAPETQARHRAQAPRGELLNSGDLAQMLVDLAQPHWRHANGATIRINGGSYV